MRGQGSHIGGPNPGLGASPVGMNSPGLRAPFGQIGNMPRFPYMQPPGGMRPPFLNNDGIGSDGARMRDSDMRAMAEPKEWPPDDEVNAEDDSDDDHPMDSDERVLSLGQHHMPAPGISNIRPHFGLHGPLPPSQGPPDSMIGIPRPQGPGVGMPPLLSLRMMPPNQQPAVLAVAGAPAPGFAVPPGGVRLPMSAAGVRQGLPASPHLIAPPPGAPLPVPVNLNGPMVVTRPGLPPSNTGGVGSIDMALSNSDVPSSNDDRIGPRPPGPVAHLQVQGSNHPPGQPILGRGFAPMTIRPRGGPGLLGSRPDSHGGPGFNRFGGPRPLMGPAFRGMDRPPFGNRFGLPLRPPLEFLDQDEREDRDERRPLRRLDTEDHVGLHVGAGQNQPNDIDERRNSVDRKAGDQDVDLRQDIDERSKPARVSGRPSRWNSSTEQAETPKPVPGPPPQIEDVPAVHTPGENLDQSRVAQEGASAAPMKPVTGGSDTNATDSSDAGVAGTNDGDLVAGKKAGVLNSEANETDDKSSS